MKRYIVGGTLIDGTGQPALPLHWLELDGERITAVEAGHGPGAPPWHTRSILRSTTPESPS